MSTSTHLMGWIPPRLEIWICSNQLSSLVTFMSSLYLSLLQTFTIPWFGTTSKIAVISPAGVAKKKSHNFPSPRPVTNQMVESHFCTAISFNQTKCRQPRHKLESSSLFPFWVLGKFIPFSKTVYKQRSKQTIRRRYGVMITSEDYRLTRNNPEAY